MTVLETRRSRRVANQKAEHLTLDSTFDDKEGYYNDTTDASIDDHIVEEKVSDGLNIPLLKQMGTYIPFEIGFDLLAALHITLVAAVIRLYRIDYPNSVVFDEIHFGKFAAKYINGTFFFDVHPPLAKMLIAGAGHWSGFDGSFNFDPIGTDFPTKVPYIHMRVFCAMFGLFTIPIAFLTIRAAGFSRLSGLVAALLMCFENGFVTNHRLILLDAPLLFFTAITALFWFNFLNQNRSNAFGFKWWAWLAATGAGLGCVVSTKWVGFLTIATIGLQVIAELWDMLCDPGFTPLKIAKHFVARAICLIAIPVVIYIACFWVHFQVLPKTGDGAIFMSTGFSSTLVGAPSVDTFADVSYGSALKIKQDRTMGAYLHSHPLYYPAGSKQQQITLYPHDDYHNNWTFVPSDRLDDPTVKLPKEPLRWVKNGDMVKIYHPVTKMYLHSHVVKAPVTKGDHHFEVSGYMFANDSNNDWQVEIIKGAKMDAQSSKRIRALRTKFRLKHRTVGCYLYARGTLLPEWGGNQQEVSCLVGAKPNDFSTFYVHSSDDSRLSSKSPKATYAIPTFWENFISLNKLMYQTNEGLTQRHAFDSRPTDWPLLHRGINYWSKDKRQVYLLGHPMAFWGSAIVACAFLALKGIITVREHRGWRMTNPSMFKLYNGPTNFLIVAWLIHWLPFFTQKRQLFLHHYMPSLYFAMLIMVVAFEYATVRLSKGYRYGIAAFLATAYLYVFWQMTPLVYGTKWTKAECEKQRLRSSWDIHCTGFPKNLKGYEITASAAAVAPANVSAGKAITN